MLQIKIYKGAWGEVEKDVNYWLTSREVKKYNILSVDHAFASDCAGYAHTVCVMIQYDDDPEINHSKPMNPCPPSPSLPG